MNVVWRRAGDAPEPEGCRIRAVSFFPIPRVLCLDWENGASSCPKRRTVAPIEHMEREQQTANK